MASFIDVYTFYHSLRTCSPKAFATHLCIQAIGHVLGRDSVNLIQPRAVHHNSNVVLMGRSGVKKSTAQEDTMVPLYPDDIVGPKSFSPEGLLREMGDNPSLICPLGEFSLITGGIKKGSYMSSFKEISNDLFTCPMYYIKTLANADNSYSIEKPYLSLNSTCTEEAFKENITTELFRGGFLPRWIIVAEKSDGYRKRGLLPVGIDEFEKKLKGILKVLYDLCKNKPITFKLTDKAFDEYDNICRGLEEDDKWQNIQPFVSRYENYIISYADIMLVSEVIGEYCFNSFTELHNITNITNLTNLTTNNINTKGVNEYIVVKLVNCVNSVTEKHIKKAWSLLKPRLEYMEELLGDFEEDVNIQKVVRVFRLKQKAILPRSILLQYSRLKARAFDEATSTLIQREELDAVIQTKGEGKAKKQTQFYKYLGAI